jgi:proteasome lid subunit RPN8/RPN11
VIRLANNDPRSTRFLADPAELLDAFQSIDADGLELVGIYHSHPISPAYPSPTDVHYARGYPQALHFIVSLQDPAHPALRVYSIDREAIAEVRVEVADSLLAPRTC